MIKHPLVSIIMPAYNCEQFINQAINCILNQSYANFELLIADDCSTDNTKKIIDSYSDHRIKTFHNSVNSGYLKASNKLLTQCNGDYITFQDADDYSVVNRIELLINAFRNDTNLGCVGSNIVSFKDFINEGTASDFPLDYETIIKRYISNVVMTGATLMITREVLSNVGHYNEFFDRIGSEDVYWYGQIIEKYKTINLKELLYFYRQNPSSVSRNHKNTKALISRELATYAFELRNNQEVDFISAKSISEQDFFCNKKFAEYYIKKGKLKLAFRYFLKVVIRINKMDFSFLKLFIRQTIYHLLKI